jgi:hypothetical protein
VFATSCLGNSIWPIGCDVKNLDEPLQVQFCIADCLRVPTPANIRKCEFRVRIQITLDESGAVSYLYVAFALTNRLFTCVD